MMIFEKKPNQDFYLKGSFLFFNFGFRYLFASEC